MIALVAAALFGATLGLLMRNRALSAVMAMLVAGLIQLIAIFVVDAMGDSPRYQTLAVLLKPYVGQGFWAAAPTMVAAGSSALLAGFMLTLMRMSQAEAGPLPGGDEMPRGRDRNGKLRRAPGMIEERPIHEVAEGRIDQLLKL